MIRRRTPDCQARQQLTVLLLDIEKGLDKDGKKMETVALILMAQYLGDIICLVREQTTVGEYDLAAIAIKQQTHVPPIVLEAKSRDKPAGVNVVIKLEAMMDYAKTHFGLIVSNKGLTRKAWSRLDQITKVDTDFRIGVISTKNIREQILGSSLEIQDSVAGLFLKTRFHEVFGKKY